MYYNFKEVIKFMYSKEDYKSFFANVSKFIKMSAVLRELNISESAFRKFMNGQFRTMSIDTCKELADFIQNLSFEKIA